jgi:hypothetical protein
MARRDKIEDLVRRWGAKPCTTCQEGPTRDELKAKFAAERKPGQQLYCPSCGEQIPPVYIDMGEI